VDGFTTLWLGRLAYLNSVACITTGQYHVYLRRFLNVIAVHAAKSPIAGRTFDNITFNILMGDADVILSSIE
jgi:hypothetical protein